MEDTEKLQFHFVIDVLMWLNEFWFRAVVVCNSSAISLKSMSSSSKSNQQTYLLHDVASSQQLDTLHMRGRTPLPASSLSACLKR
jgi:hypothetical protein